MNRFEQYSDDVLIAIFKYARKLRVISVANQYAITLNHPYFTEKYVPQPYTIAAVHVDEKTGRAKKASFESIAQVYMFVLVYVMYTRLVIVMIY